MNFILKIENWTYDLNDLVGDADSRDRLLDDFEYKGDGDRFDFLDRRDLHKQKLVVGTQYCCYYTYDCSDGLGLLLSFRDEKYFSLGDSESSLWNSDFFMSFVSFRL